MLFGRGVYPGWRKRRNRRMGITDGRGEAVEGSAARGTERRRSTSCAASSSLRGSNVIAGDNDNDDDDDFMPMAPRRARPLSPVGPYDVFPPSPLFPPIPPVSWMQRTLYPHMCSFWYPRSYPHQYVWSVRMMLLCIRTPCVSIFHDYHGKSIGHTNSQH